MENSRGKRNIGEWSLWTGLAVLGGLSVYYYPLFSLTMFLTPAVWAALAFRTRPSMLAVAAALVFLFGYLMGFGALNRRASWAPSHRQAAASGSARRSAWATSGASSSRRCC